MRIEEKPKGPPSFLAVAKDVAPLVTGIGTLVLSLASFYFLRLQDREKSDLALAEVRLKALPAAAEPDDTKREIGAMGVAIYGKTAAPVIRFLLSGSSQNANMRPFGVQVVGHWLDSADAQGRADVLAELFADARADAANLREGAYSALVTISRRLSKQENQQLLALIQERFGGATPPETDPNVAQTACPLLNNYDYTAVRLLLRTMARVAPGQALQSYVTVLTRPCDAEARQALANDLTAADFPDSFKPQQRGLIAQAGKGCAK